VAEYKFFTGIGANPAILPTFRIKEGAFFSNNGSKVNVRAIADPTFRLIMYRRVSRGRFR
jgi:hypothetical protein